MQEKKKNKLTNCYECTYIPMRVGYCELYRYIASVAL